MISPDAEEPTPWVVARETFRRGKRRVRKDLMLTRGARAERLARWYFRDATSIGARPLLKGRPLVTTPDLVIGDDFLVWSHYRQTHLGGTGRLVIGDRVFLNAGVVILAYECITLEDDVGLASEVFVSDSNNHRVGDQPMKQAPVYIERGAWIATRAMILPGVHIGRRAVVAAGAVVTRDVPADTLVAGTPAVPIRKIEYPPNRMTAWKDDDL